MIAPTTARSTRQLLPVQSQMWRPSSFALSWRGPLVLIRGSIIQLHYYRTCQRLGAAMLPMVWQALSARNGARVTASAGTIFSLRWQLGNRGPLYCGWPSTGCFGANFSLNKCGAPGAGDKVFFFRREKNGTTAATPARATNASAKTPTLPRVLCPNMAACRPQNDRMKFQ